jgi:sporulation protein YlmC with PRC-barrel domain
MLQLSRAFLGKPVLSLRNGMQVATTMSAIINPDNFKIEGFFCYDQRSKKMLVLVYQDIRDVLPQGLVVNDYDVLADAEDLVRLKKIINIGFDPLGKQVRTVSKRRIGKVSDYAVEVETMYIQKLYVSQSIIRSFTGGNLGIDRSQIHEVTPKKIIIQDIEKTVPAPAGVPA